MEDMAMRPLIKSVHVERELIKIRRSMIVGADVFTEHARRGRKVSLL
jgi:hypothetical protein